MSSLLLTVFTHPACSGCPEAVREAWALAETRPDLELKTVTLAEKAGLAEARREGVTLIPALILRSGGEELARWQGMPATDVLEAALQHASTNIVAST